jgi:hypothetical protein
MKRPACAGGGHVVSCYVYISCCLALVVTCRVAYKFYVRVCLLFSDRYCTRDQTVRYAYVTSLSVEGKQTHILCKPKTLPTYELRQRTTTYCHWEIKFIVWKVYVSYVLPLPSL